MFTGLKNLLMRHLFQSEYGMQFIEFLQVLSVLGRHIVDDLLRRVLNTSMHFVTLACIMRYVKCTILFFSGFCNGYQ